MQICKYKCKLRCTYDLYLIAETLIRNNTHYKKLSVRMSIEYIAILYIVIKLMTMNN